MDREIEKRENSRERKRERSDTLLCVRVWVYVCAKSGREKVSVVRWMIAVCRWFVDPSKRVATSAVGGEFSATRSLCGL